MLEQRKHTDHDWEAMSSEELEQLLQDDLEQNLLCEEELLQISAELAKRESPEAQGSTDEAWLEFCEHYRPNEGEECFLFDWDDEEEQNAVADGETPSEKVVEFPKHRARWMVELAAAAAVFAAVLLLGQGEVPAAEPEFPNAQISATLNQKISEKAEQEKITSDDPAVPEETQGGDPYDTTDYGERNLGNNSQGGADESDTEEDDTIAIMAMGVDEEPEESGSGSGEQSETQGDSSSGESGDTGNSGTEPGSSAEPPSEPSTEESGGDSGIGDGGGTVEGTQDNVS